MSSRRTVGLLMICSALSFGGGVAIGFFQGLLAQDLLDSTPRAALAVSNLNALNRGETEPIRLLLESQVDLALASYPYIQERWWHPLYESSILFIDPTDSQAYIEKIASYRKQNTSPLLKYSKSIPADALTAHEKNIYIEIEEHHSKINDAVSKYAK